MHAMSTFACATFITSVDVRQNMRRPAFRGYPAVQSADLRSHTPGPGAIVICTLAGEVLLIGGWVVLIWSASSIDRISAPNNPPLQDTAGLMLSVEK